MNNAQKARLIALELARNYPLASCTLAFSSPFELLVATMLAAQCTDERVNRLTPGLFTKYNGPAAFAGADLRELEEDVRPAGFFRHKAKNIQAMSQALLTRHEGQVPQTLEELTALPGVGRKTANVILGNVFGQPALAVDTHVGRLSRRLGLSRETDPAKVEQDLMALVPPGEWVNLSHRLIAHGRAVCRARAPVCGECVIVHYCDYFSNQIGA